MLDDPKMWWPFRTPAPEEEIAAELNLKLAAVHAPIAMGCASLLLFFEHGPARIRFSHTMPLFGLAIIASVIALRLIIAHVWNARARRR